MKILSEFKELEGQVFDTVKACQAAERAVEEQRKANSLKEKDASKLKKALAQQVDASEQQLAEAYANYDKAKKEVKKIINECNARVNEILEPAKNAVQQAEAAKRAAIIEYNTKCGPYQKVYTGEKANEEYSRVLKYFNTLWDEFFNF